MAVLEVLMHAIVFNVGVRDIYNPGLLTALFGLLPLSLRYFVPAIGAGAYTWVDLVCGLVWVVVNYWFAFRSPFYQWLGRKENHAFSDDEVWRDRRWIERAQRRG